MSRPDRCVTGLPWEKCGYERIPTECEVCGEGQPVAIVVGLETLAWCQACLDEAEDAWKRYGETSDMREVFR